jgi:sugar/nucleoside kinase (ribokinase family)
MLESVDLQPVDYLVIGHVTEDLTAAGPRPGGTATFAALTARSLGLRVGVLTAAGQNASLAALDEIQVVAIPSEYSTTFENLTGQHGRTQVLHRQAAPIPYERVPESWRQTPILHLAPVAQELEAELPSSFSPALLGITPQGWMRTWDSQGQVVPSEWENAGLLLPQAGAVVISREDLGGDDEQIDWMAQQTRLLAVTEGPAGCVLYWHGDRRRFRPPEVEEVDATGAGDIFAAAFFVRLLATRDPWEAARFATHLSARSVARTGLDGIPTAAEIEECLMEVF